MQQERTSHTQQSMHSSGQSCGIHASIMVGVPHVYTRRHVHRGYACTRGSLSVNTCALCHTRLQEWPGTDLLVECAIWRDRITAVLQVEPPPKKASNTLGTFVLSIMPPGPEESVSFPRDVVFVWDCSGSMQGDKGIVYPMQQCDMACSSWLSAPGSSVQGGVVQCHFAVLRNELLSSQNLGS